MAEDVDGVHFVISDFDACRIGVGVDLTTGRRAGLLNAKDVITGRSAERLKAARRLLAKRSCMAEAALALSGDRKALRSFAAPLGRTWDAESALNPHQVEGMLVSDERSAHVPGTEIAVLIACWSA